MATLPINPASFNRALESPRGMAIGLVMSPVGGRQTTFLVYTLFLGVAWRLFLAGGGTPALLEKEEGRGKRFSGKNRRERLNVRRHYFEFLYTKKKKIRQGDHHSVAK